MFGLGSGRLRSCLSFQLVNTGWMVFAAKISKLSFDSHCSIFIFIGDNYPDDIIGMLFRHDSEAAPQGKGAPCVEINFYVTNTGLLLRYHSHVDSCYKHGLLVTMLDHAHRLSSSWAHFSEECERLREVFRKLRYPNHPINSIINRFVTSRVAVGQPTRPGCCSDFQTTT